MSWKLKEFKRSMFTVFEVIDENGEVIKTFVADELTYSEKKRKAQLMAAAPELLEAAKKAKERIESMNDLMINTLKVPVPESRTNYLENAINKAKGPSE